MTKKNGCFVAFVSIGLLISLIMLIGGVVAGLTSVQGVVSQERNEVLKAAEVLPPDEQGFIDYVSAAKLFSITPKNPMQRKDLSKNRFRDLCRGFKFRHAANWVGKITNIDTTFASGSVVLKVRLPSDDADIYISTNDNVFSDVEQNTLIENGGALYNSVYHLSVGDSVIFSGGFMYSGGCVDTDGFASDSDYLDGFNFIFKFTEIKVVQNSV